MTAPAPAPAGTASGLATSPYLRERSAPRPGDPFYLHLRDVLDALRPHATEAPVAVLDFGSGGSPYRSLFPSARFLRADLAGEGLDFQISPDGRIPEATSAAFDVILSTQVLEHVPDPTLYLAECRRLLRPGGKLLLTTHGFFEEHLCPDDYFRWTADGLRLVLQRAGFHVDGIKKLTTSGRALCFLISRSLFLGAGSPPASFAFFCRAANWLLRPLLPLLHRLADAWFDECRVVPAARPGHPVYAALLAEASVA